MVDRQLPTSADEQNDWNLRQKAFTAEAERRILVDIDGNFIVSKDGLLKIINCDSIIPSRCVGVSPNRNLQITSFSRLVGTTFDGDTLDTNFWGSTLTNGGTVTINGEAELETNTTADGTAKLVSVRKGRFVASNPMEFKSTVEWYTEGDADNLRRIGVYDSNDGFFFQLDGTTFSIGTRTYKSGSAVDTLVNSGSFNGDVTTFAPGTTRHKCAIQFTTTNVYFIIDGVFIHKVTLDHDNSPTTFTLPITLDNVNDNSNDTNNELHVVGVVINRMGEFLTNSTYKFISTNTTTICKYTAGILHKIINCDNAGAITVYDNTSAAGAVIATVDTAKALGTLNFNAPFNTGLTVVSSGGAKVTVVYE